MSSSAMCWMHERVAKWFKKIKIELPISAAIHADTKGLNLPSNIAILRSIACCGFPPRFRLLLCRLWI